MTSKNNSDFPFIHVLAVPPF